MDNPAVRTEVRRIMGYWLQLGVAGFRVDAVPFVIELLNWMASMIRLRKECPEIGWGKWTLLKTGASAVLGLRYEWKGNALVVLHNFSGKPREARLQLPDDKGAILTNLRHNDESRADLKGQHRITLEAYGYRWYRVGRLDHLLARRKI